MKLWIAHWLRKIATRLDGERYVHAPKGHLAAFVPEGAQVLITTLGGGGGGYIEQRRFPNVRISKADLEDRPLPIDLATGGLITKPKPYLFGVGDEIKPVKFEDRT